MFFSILRKQFKRPNHDTFNNYFKDLEILK